MKLRKILIIEYTFIALMTVFCLFLYKNAIYNQLKEWKLVYIPESFTELYFTDHLNLPTTISANTEQSFKFTIHNLENEDKGYSWEVYRVEDTQLDIAESSEASGTKTNEIKNTEEASESTAGTTTTDLQKITVIKSGYDLIKNGNSKDIEIKFKLDKVFKRQKIEVKLVDLNQTIHYWVVGLGVK